MICITVWVGTIVTAAVIENESTHFNITVEYWCLTTVQMLFLLLIVHHGTILCTWLLWHGVWTDTPGQRFPKSVITSLLLIAAMRLLLRLYSFLLSLTLPTRTLWNTVRDRRMTALRPQSGGHVAPQTAARQEKWLMCSFLRQHDRLHWAICRSNTSASCHVRLRERFKTKTLQIRVLKPAGSTANDCYCVCIFFVIKNEQEYII